MCDVTRLYLSHSYISQGAIPKVLRTLQARAQSPRANFTYEVSHPKITNCLCIDLSVYVSIYRCVYPSIYPSIDPLFYLIIPKRNHELSIYLLICLCIYLSMCLPIYLSIVLSYYSQKCYTFYKRTKSPRAKFRYEGSHPKITNCLSIY